MAFEKRLIVQALSNAIGARYALRVTEAYVSVEVLDEYAEAALTAVKSVASGSSEVSSVRGVTYIIIRAAISGD